MLVLSRARNERIRIGDNIIITVVDVHGDKVRLGFSAPPDVKIHREEVYWALKDDERLARDAEKAGVGDAS